MPIEYAGGGVLAEHAAVRSAVGLFDVSHLGTATVRGPGAAAFVDACLTNDMSRIGPGQAQYTLCCDADGGVVDDLILYLHGPDDVLLVPNAANAAEVIARLRADAPAGVEGDRPARGGRRPRRPGPAVAAGAGAARHAGRAVLHVVRDRHRPGGARRSPSAGPATPASTATSCWSRPGGPATSGTPSSTPGRTSASGRAGSAPATRCAPRWAIRCTATSCPARSAPCRRGPGGRWAGRSRRSGAARRCWPSARRGRRGCCGGCAPPAVASRDPAWRCSVPMAPGR